MNHNYTKYISILFLLVTFFSVNAQDRPNETMMQSPTTATWLGSYGNFRLSDKFIWDAQLHYRRAGSDNTPYIGRMAQIYNRHGLKFTPTKNFHMTLGGVLRIDFTPDPDNPDFEKTILEPRIWHEYMFAFPFDRLMIYQRLRFEHRWSRQSFIPNSGWDFRHRYRYYIKFAYPINNTKLVPGTFMLYPDAEIILQSGNPVVDSPVDDMRLHAAVGYIASPRVKYSLGMMWTTGQELDMGYSFKSRWVFRFNVYYSFDFRKFENKIPEIRIDD